MSVDVNNTIQSSVGQIIRINWGLLQSFSFGFLAWVIWPDKLLSYELTQGWGWAFLGIVCILVSLASFVGSVQAMVRLYNRDKALARFMEQGSGPKSSGLASGDALDRAGMHE
ncbi:MAG: hypothetical protein AAF542_07455 [Pseudomonadota bacterium]